MSIDYQVFRMTARIFLIKVIAEPIFGKEMSCGKSSLQEDSGQFPSEFGHRRCEPFQQRFAADGLSAIKFFDKQAGAIDIDFLLSQVNQYNVNNVFGYLFKSERARSVPLPRATAARLTYETAAQQSRAIAVPVSQCCMFRFRKEYS